MPTTAFTARRRSRVLRLAVLPLALALAAAAAPPAAALPIGTGAFQDCAEGFLKNSSKLLKKHTSTLVQCSTKLLACQLEEELAGGDFASCSARISAACAKKLDKLVKLEDGVRGKLAKSCERLADHDYGATVGLGLRRLRAECGPVTSAAEASDCLISRARCRAAEVAESIAPRTYELLDAAGLVASHPDSTSCLEVRAPSAAVAGDPDALAGCQKGVAKALAKPFYKLPKDVSKCVGELLVCRLHADRRLANLPQPPACYAAADAASACGKAEGKLAAAIGSDPVDKAAGSCAGLTVDDLKTSLNFAADCPAAATVGDVLACARDAMSADVVHLVDDTVPRTCQLAGESGDGLFALADFCAPECGNNVVEDGEACDDGNLSPNDTCTNDCQTGPTDHESVLIPATRTPAHCPDGTPANAVDPGSSVATQFGTTTPNLNNASYVRYFAPGAGDPDAVLVLVPGFAGGAHSLKIVAETMVAKAAAEGSIVLEVWNFDRRTDQLEDDEGGELAETEDDPELALNWYFGDELGLALDPRITRRAEFHQSSDLAFLAGFTYNQFIHDIDAVVDAAAALPGSPTVFLGGHSLGTLFSARYAATDLDPGVALVPGHDKVAGLVLFEGGGDSMPIGTPSDDALDLVIARADGGLYHAIRDEAPRCWNGAPCVTNADCAAEPLATGALTNKCVEPVDAFVGGVISPEIHAVGDAVSVQARRHPDSMSIAQEDFGSGSAVDVVPGLSLLGFLPDGSAEATVGFFLDDDYSPEVSFQVSMGFSDNGPNTDLGASYLAAPAPDDPYRLWKGIDWPMPPAALVDHGVPADAFDLNGVENEVSTMENVLTMVRTGDRNIGDWYFASSGLQSTAELIVGVGGFTGGLDSSALSVTRGRPDIENLTEGPNIDIPVISFGGTNGISPTLGAMLPFAESIATCAAASCDGTARVVASDPITPAYGGIEGGFEVYVPEGYAHIDVVAAEDDPSHNEVYDPLLAFLERNTTP